MFSSLLLKKEKGCSHLVSRFLLDQGIPEGPCSVEVKEKTETPMGYRIVRWEVLQMVQHEAE